jgi:hypothetical protein
MMIDAIFWYTGLDARQSAGGVRRAAPSARFSRTIPGSATSALRMAQTSKT